MAGYESITKEMWFKTTEGERVRMIENVTRLVDYEARHVVRTDTGLAVEGVGTRGEGRLPLGLGPLEEGVRIPLETSEDYHWKNWGKLGESETNSGEFGPQLDLLNIVFSTTGPW